MTDAARRWAFASGLVLVPAVLAMAEAWNAYLFEPQATAHGAKWAGLGVALAALSRLAYFASIWLDRDDCR